MTSYIGYDPEVTVDPINQAKDQLITIEDGITVYALNEIILSDLTILVYVNREFYIPVIDYYLNNNQITFINPLFPSSGSIYILYHGTHSYRINKVSDQSIQYQHLSSGLKSFDFQVIQGNGIDQTFSLDFIPPASSSVLVHKNKELLYPGINYSILGNRITFLDIPEVTDSVSLLNLGFKTTSIDHSSIEALESTSINFKEISENVIINDQVSKKFLANTSTQPISIILPSTPISGQFIEIIDATDSFDENPCTVIRNGKPINSLLENSFLYKRGIHCLFVYVEAIDSWKVVFYNQGIEYNTIQSMVSAFIECV